MTGEELLQQGQARNLFSAADANRVRRDALISGEQIEAIMWRERIAPDDAIAQLKSELLKVPYKKFDPAAVDDKLFQLIPEDTARTYEAIPISQADNLLIVGMLHPDDTKAQDALKFIARKNSINLGVYLIAYNDYEAVMRRYSPYRTEISRAIQSLNVKEGSAQRLTEIEGSAGSEDAPIIKIVADTFREAMEVAILPRIDDFAPDLVIISAGFDAHRRDPLGNLNLVEADYVWATRKLMELAQKHCGGRVVSVLEGGSDLEGLARSVAAHVSTLMEG